jgi:hypothetical protein
MLMKVPLQIVEPANPSLGQLEASLHALLAALLKHRQARPTPPTGVWTRVKIADPLELRAREIAEDPIDYALRQGVRMVGKSIRDLYGTGAMQSLAKSICESSPPDIAAPLNHALDGVGGWGA